MGSPGELIDRIEALRSLMERLCAPDLTLAEAKSLRPDLCHLLNPGMTDGDPGRPAASRRLVALQDR